MSRSSTLLLAGALASIFVTGCGATPKPETEAVLDPGERAAPSASASSPPEPSDARPVSPKKDDAGHADERSGSAEASVAGFLSDVESFTTTIQAGKVPADSRKAFDAVRPALASKFAGIKDLPSSAVSKKTGDRLDKAMTDATVAVCDPTAASFDKSVCADFTTMFK